MDDICTRIESINRTETSCTEQQNRYLDIRESNSVKVDDRLRMVVVLEHVPEHGRTGRQNQLVSPNHLTVGNLFDKESIQLKGGGGIAQR